MSALPPSIIIQKKKRTSQPLTTYKQPSSSIKTFKPGTSMPITKSDVQDVFPVPIDQSQLTPQLKQYIFDMQKQYLELQSTLMNNRQKYQQLFGGLAAILDQRGVPAEDLAKFFNKSIYYPPETQ